MDFLRNRTNRSLRMSKKGNQATFSSLQINPKNRNVLELFTKNLKTSVKLQENLQIDGSVTKQNQNIHLSLSQSESNCDKILANKIQSCRTVTTEKC